MALPVEQLAAELRLQQLDASGDGGLGQVQLPRRLPHAARTPDRNQISQLLEFHQTISFYYQ